MSGEFAFELAGDLMVHGVTRSVTWIGSARADGRTVTGSASTRVRITDFGMELPNVFRELSIENELTLKLDFRAQRAPIPGPADFMVDWRR